MSMMQGGSQAPLSIPGRRILDRSATPPAPVLSLWSLSLGSSDEEDGGGSRRELSWGFDGTPSPLARVRGCDVYIGHGGAGGGRAAAVVGTMVAWLKAELELQGVPCFVSDRRRCSDAVAHAAVSAAMDAAAVGVVAVTPWSLSNRYCIEELRVFLGRRRLVPVFFGLTKGDCVARDIVHMRGQLWAQFGGELWEAYDGVESDWREVVDGLSRAEPALEVNPGNLRDRVHDAIEVIGQRLGRLSTTEAVKNWRAAAESELPYLRNGCFVGRRKELLYLEAMLLGDEQPQDKDAGKRPMGLEETIGERSYVEGVGCVCGESGAGKTELLLEFAHRHSQKYKRALWVSGEARYLRQSYLNLADHLGISISDDLSADRNTKQSFRDIEGEAIDKIKKELMRDIPYLLIIDNLESEKDWWDGKSILDLLPRRRTRTYVIISTRLSGLSGVKSLRLPALALPEAMLLMKGRRMFDTGHMDVLRAIEQKLCGLPLGLALVGAILAELAVSPLELLTAMNDTPYRAPTWGSKEDAAVWRNPGLVQLLDACFALLDKDRNLGAMVTRMVEAGSFFPPAPVPVSMLAQAACGASEGSQHRQFWRRLLRTLPYRCNPAPSSRSNATRAEAEALSTLTRLGIARSCTRPGYISFHGVFRLYARNAGDGQVARSVLRAIVTEDGVQQHPEHVWATCLSVFRLESSPRGVELPAQGLASFVRRFVLPVASQSVTTYSAFSPVLVLLRAATDAVQEAEGRYLSEPSNGSRSRLELDPFTYRDLASLRAALLKFRAQLMIKGGELDIAAQLCTMAIGICEVVHGEAHPETQAVQAVLDQVLKLQLKL